MEEVKQLVTMLLDNNPLEEHLKTKVDMMQEEDPFLHQDIVLEESEHQDHTEPLVLVQDQELDQDSLHHMVQEPKVLVLLEQATTKTNHSQVLDTNLTKQATETQALMCQEHLTLTQTVVTPNLAKAMAETKDRDQVRTTPTNQKDNDLFIFIKFIIISHSILFNLIKL